MHIRTGLRFLLALAGLAQASSAQTLARFAPPERAAPDVLELRFVRERGQAIEQQPWPASEIGWLFVREEGTQRNYDALTPLAVDATRLSVARAPSGAALVGWDLPPRVESMSRSALQAFLAERTGEKTLPRELEPLAALESLAVTRLESLALIVRAQEAAAEPSAIAISKSGQRMELRALMDPSFIAAGSEFVFKLYEPEGGAQGVYVRAVHLDDRATRPVQRLPDGTLRARLEPAGPWMLEVVRLRALDGAALELASSTLVFEVSAAGAQQGSGK